MKDPVRENKDHRIREPEQAVPEAGDLEKALKESEEKFRALTDATPTAVMLYQDNRWIYANPAASAMTGYTVEELLNLNFWDTVYPDDQSVVRKRGEKRQSGDEATYHYEIRIVTKSGEEKWVDLASASTLINGRPAGVVSAADITGRKRMEEKLRKSEEKYRLLTETLPDVVFTTDENLRMTYVSPAVTRLRGYSVEEAMAESLEHLLTPESLKIALAGFNEEMKLEAAGWRDPDRVLKLELEATHKNGSTIWTEVIFQPIRNEEGTFVGVLAVARDIGDRKRAQEQLRKSEEKYRLLTETLPEVVFTMDVNLQFTYVSSSNLQLNGYTPGEMMTKSVDEVLTPSSLTTVMELYTSILEKEEQGLNDRNKTWKLEMEIFCKDGSAKWTEAIYHALRDADGKYVGLLGIIRDISDRRQAQEQLRKSEEKYRLLTETSPDVIFTLDSDLRFTYVSSSVFQRYGFPVEEAMTMSAWEALTPASLKYATSIFACELAKEKNKPHEITKTWTLELEGYCKDGSTKWAETIFSALRDTAGNFVGLLGISRDISERKRAQAEREKLIEERERALSEVKVLGGMLPICSSCKKIRNDEGYWEQLEHYISEHSGAEFSHGLCPECAMLYLRKRGPNSGIAET